MDVVELIGFLISFFAFVFLMFRRAMRKGTEEADEDTEQEKKLKDFLKSLNIEVEEEEEELVQKPVRPPPLPRPPKPLPHKGFETYSFDSKLTSYKQQSAIETRKLQTQLQASMDEKSPQYKAAVNDYHMIQKEKPSRVKKIILGLRSPKDIIILNEILKRPNF